MSVFESSISPRRASTSAGRPELDLDRLGRIVRGLAGLDVAGDEHVDELAAVPGRRPVHRPRLPRAAAVARLLPQLALRRLERLLVPVDHAGRQLHQLAADTPRGTGGRARRSPRCRSRAPRPRPAGRRSPAARRPSARRSRRGRVPGRRPRGSRAQARAASTSASVTSTIASRSATAMNSSELWMRLIPFARFAHGRPFALKTFASAPPPGRDRATA